MAKKMYRVWASYLTYCYADIEASSAEEAVAIADHMDAGEFVTCEDGDWEIYPAHDVEEL